MLNKNKKPIARISATTIMENNTERELSFGEKRVQRNFNPSANDKAEEVKI